jgi:pilus assembly protein CpaB
VNKRLISVFMFAVVVAAAASFLVYQLISRQMANSSQAPGTPVVVATRDLDVGALVKPDDLKIDTWNGPAPEGSFNKIDDVAGRGVVYAIFRGEAVMKSRLAERDAGAGLAATIPAGYRAVAVRVNEVVGISGFATPGMKVDVLVTGVPPGAAAAQLGTLNKTLLQNIEVLSAGQNIQKDAEGKPVIVPVVNLKVTPEQAELLSLASTDAKIQLILRNPADKEIVKTPGAAMSNLFNGGAPPVQAAAPPPRTPRKPVARVEKAPPPPPAAPAPVVAVEKPPAPIKVEVIQGSKRLELQFPGEERKVEHKSAPASEGVPAEGKVRSGGDDL